MDIKIVNFTKLNNDTYHYIVEPNDYIFLITFANKNTDVKLYFIVNNKRYFLKQIKSNEDENNIIIDIYKDIFKDNKYLYIMYIENSQFEICTNHEITNCSVIYNNEIPT